MMSQGSQEDEAAVLLGASSWKMFWRVTLPNIRWALLYGVVLTNARAIGEFGAVSVVSGLFVVKPIHRLYRSNFCTKTTTLWGFLRQQHYCHDGNYYING